MRKLLACLMIFGLLLNFCAMGAAATEDTEEPTNVPREPGFCGEKLEWSFDGEEGILTITGEGEMDDFPEGAPWEEYREKTVEVVLSEDVTYIGENAFRDFDKLEKVDFGKKLKEVGKEAFKSCDALTQIHLPDTFKVFGESSFQSCSKLKEIRCDGVFPSFRMNSLWDTYAKIIFPADRPWGVTYIQQLEEAFNGRIEFMASDGTDPYVPTEPEETTEATEETTQATTQATEEVTTQATEAVTEEATQPTAAATEATQPPTESTTEPDTTADSTAAPSTEATQPTQPEEEENERKLAVWIIPALIVGVISFLVAGAVLSGSSGKKRRKSRSRGGRYMD